MSLSITKFREQEKTYLSMKRYEFQTGSRLGVKQYRFAWVG